MKRIYWVCLVTVILLSIPACGIRPIPVKDRDVIGTLESETQYDFFTDENSGRETAKPETIPDTGAPSETAQPVTQPETVYGEETGAETDPYGVGNLPDISQIWAFQPEPPAVTSKYPLPDNFFSEQLNDQQKKTIGKGYYQNRNERIAFLFDLPIRNEIGDIVKAPFRSCLGDPEYINQHTIGFYLLQNKQTSYYLTSNTVLYYAEHPEEYIYAGGEYSVLLEQNLINTTFAGAQIVRIVRLTNGSYGLLFTYYGSDSLLEMQHYPVLQAVDWGRVDSSAAGLSSLYNHSWIIQKTESGAYRLTTQYLDSHMITKSVKIHEGKYETVRYYGTLCQTEQDYEGYYRPRPDEPYTNDSDYSDEWLFIPVKGSPEFNP